MTKINDELKQIIQYRYFNEKISMKQLGNVYDISKTSVFLILNPEKKEELKVRNTKNRKKYYNKEKNKEYVKKFRAKSKSLNTLK